MGELVLLVVIGTSIWVAVDASSLRSRYGKVSGMGAAGWFFACLLLWIVAFPLYLAKRGDVRRAVEGQWQSQLVQAAPLAAPAEPVAAERLCPWCAERIKAAARICRYCNREIEPVPDVPHPTTAGSTPPPPPQASVHTPAPAPGGDPVQTEGQYRTSGGAWEPAQVFLTPHLLIVVPPGRAWSEFQLSGIRNVDELEVPSGGWSTIEVSSQVRDPLAVKLPDWFLERLLTALRSGPPAFEAPSVKAEPTLRPPAIPSAIPSIRGPQSGSPATPGPRAVPMQRPGALGPPTTVRGETAGHAVAATIVGALSLLLLAVASPLLAAIGAVAAIALGYVARRRIGESAGALSGEGLAVAGLFLGCVTATIAGLVILASAGSGGGQDGVASSACAIELRTLRTAVVAYRAQNGTNPANVDALVAAGILEGRSDYYEFSEDNGSITFTAISSKCSPPD